MQDYDENSKQYLGGENQRHIAYTLGISAFKQVMIFKSVRKSADVPTSINFD